MCLVAPCYNSIKPVFLVQFNLCSIYFTVETTTYLCVTMAIEAQYGQIIIIVIIWIIIYMMNLDDTVPISTDAACPIRVKEDSCSC